MATDERDDKYIVGGDTRISDLLRGIPRRVDGAALIISVAITLASAFAPSLGFDLGKFKAGSIAYPLLWFIPILFVLYCSLVYFSSNSIVSRIFNSIILITVPIYLVFAIIGRA